MAKDDKLLQIVLYRNPRETYFCFYQNKDGTFARVVTDVKGVKTWVNFLSASDTFLQLYNASLLGYHVADLKTFPHSKHAKLHEEFERTITDD